VTDDWTAMVERLDHLDPNRDSLIVKVRRNITREQAEQIKAAIHRELPRIKVLIFAGDYDVIVVKKRRARTLVRAMRKRR
jgi:hypothetical protein